MFRLAVFALTVGMLGVALHVGHTLLSVAYAVFSTYMFLYLAGRLELANRYERLASLDVYVGLDPDGEDEER